MIVHILPWAEVYLPGWVGLLFDPGAFPYRWVIVTPLGDRLVARGDDGGTCDGR